MISWKIRHSYSRLYTYSQHRKIRLLECNVKCRFWAANGTRLTARSDFTEPKKISISREPNPLKIALVMDLAASKALRTGPYKS
jgi:hypothetical protein